ncbi:MAG: glycyl-radical enzyme activating protein [Bacteroidales bacterium]|nr:glycyl-radical enzyme activating protein [Bacteroidales bacterium]
MSVAGIIFNIQRFSVNDGPGIRTTVFLKGCPLSCWWCHNPEGRAQGIVKINGNTIGQSITPEKLLKILLKDRVFYEESGGGVTFSGGEPLAQPEFLSEILSLCRQAGIHTTVDTTGYADQAIFKDMLPITDLWLYDLKLMDPVQHLKYTEVSNYEILANLEYLMKNQAQVIIRIPLIPGITATQVNIEQLITYLDKFDPKPEVNLLPYHKIAIGKYQKFNITDRMIGVEELSKEETDRYAAQFENSYFMVQIGG